MNELTNWAGNHVYRARGLLEPRSLDELQGIVRRSEQLRVLGSRHSFNDLVDTTGELVSLGRLPAEIAIDEHAATARVPAQVRYGDLSQRLDAAGFAIPNLASLPHISVAGACATGTHGSGDAVGNLATAVSAIELVRADGELVRMSRVDDADRLETAVVGLGALGVVVGLTLELERRFSVRQRVYEGLSLATFMDRFDEITASAYSVSFFTDWTDASFHQVWLKTIAVGNSDEPPVELFGARQAVADLHPIRGFPADACTTQRGVPGPWHHRLPHFRLDHTPSAGAELQSEYLIDRRHIGAAVEAVQRLHARVAPLVYVSEIRTVAADELTLSPSYRRSSAAIHFTWKPDWPAVRGVLPDIERALEPFEPRPHWGKLFTMAPEVVASRYPHRQPFAALADQLDPAGTFRNDFVNRFVFS